MQLIDIRLSVQQNQPTPKGRNLCSELRSFYNRNIGRPVSESLMRDLLVTLGEYIAVPRTIDGLQPKRGRDHRADRSVSTVIVCGVCCITRFDEFTSLNSVLCPLFCQRKLFCNNNDRCRSCCVLRSSRAVRSSYAACGVGPSLPKSKAAFYVSTVRRILQVLFSSSSNALDLLEPFDGVGAISWIGKHSFISTANRLVLMIQLSFRFETRGRI